MRAAAIPTGMRLGRYEIVRHLATGGMAEIYLARASGIGDFERYVVIKVIAGERRGNAQFVRMFLDEARLAAGLHHACIAQVYEVGEDGGEFYYAMEYVHGDTVRSLLEDCSRLQVRIPLEVAIAVAIGAASGLHHAHERESADGRPLDIVHRDVSPSNVMIGYDGAVKVLDFGIARASERATETESGVVKGKYAYMAPEQCRAQAVDRRADVFALGIVLYELATQHRAFKADSDFETMSRIVNGEIAPPTTLVPGFPPALEAIVLRAMAPAPAQRYQTAAELGDALEAFAEGHGMAISQRAVERFMHQVYGARPEPWRAAGGAARGGGGTPRPGLALPLPAPAGSQPSASAAGLRTPGPSAPATVALTPPPAPPPRTDSLIAPAVTVTPAAPPARRSLVRPIAVGMALVAAGVIAAVLAAGGSAPAASATAPAHVAGAGPVAPPSPSAASAPAAAPAPTPSPAAPAPPAAPPVEAPPPATPATVTIHLASTPPGAAVFVGSRRQGVTPLDLTLPRGDRPVAVRLERPGYRVQGVALRVDADGSRAVTLAPVKKPSRPRGGGDADGFANPFAK